MKLLLRILITAAVLFASAASLAIAQADNAAQPSAGQCTSARPLGNPLQGAVWNGWGVDASNSRFQSAQAAGLRAEDVPKLKLKWAFGFPNASSSFSQPTVAAGRVLVGRQDGSVWSLDAATRFEGWTD